MVLATVNEVMTEWCQCCCQTKFCLQDVSSWHLLALFICLVIYFAFF